MNDDRAVTILRCMKRDPARRPWWLIGAIVIVAGCGGADAPRPPPLEGEEPPPVASCGSADLSKLTTKVYVSPDGSDAQLAFEPADFIQVNGPLSQAMVQQSIDWLAPRPGDSVLELFAGLGNFTVPLAKTGAIVTAVEGDKGLVARGDANCKANGVGEVQWHVADLFKPDPQAPYLQSKFDLALIDPPRAGAVEIMPLLISKKPKRILYVSCHPATLARDAALLAEGGYVLTRAGAMDMFPHTSHVESMALFERSEKKK